MSKSKRTNISWVCFAVCTVGLFLLAACGSVKADGMVEQPGTSAASRDKNNRISSNQTVPIKRVGRKGNTTPLSEFELARYQYCGKDSDCVAEINGCCDCSNGGQEVAINKSRVEAFRGNFECLHVACGDNVAQEACGDGVLSCVNHRCKYFSEDSEEKEAGK